MSKQKEGPAKNNKKVAQKSLKEKRAEKKEKQKTKNRESL